MSNENKRTKQQPDKMQGKTKKKTQRHGSGTREELAKKCLEIEDTQSQSYTVTGSCSPSSCPVSSCSTVASCSCSCSWCSSALLAALPEPTSMLTAAWCMGWLALLLGGLQSSISLSSPCPSAPPSCVLLLLLLSALMCCCCCCASCSCDSGSTSTEDAVEARLVLPAVFAPPEAMLSSPPCCCCCCCMPSCSRDGLAAHMVAPTDARADASPPSAAYVWPGFFLNRNPAMLSRMLRLRPASTSDASDVRLPALLRTSSRASCAAMLAVDARFSLPSPCFPSPPLLSSPPAEAAALLLLLLLSSSLSSWAAAAAASASSCSSPSANLTPEPADLAGFLVLRSQKVCISPLPLMFCTPRDSILAHGACDRMRSAAAPDMWMRLRSLELSMRDAVFTVSPNRQYRGLRLPTTLATTGPLWKPTRMFTVPSSGRSASMNVDCAAFTASSANMAMRSAWSCCGSTRLVAAMYASPIVSTLNTPCLRVSSSKVEYSLSSMSETAAGVSCALMLVKPTMSEKKMVTSSLCSGCTFLPSSSRLAMCAGNTSLSTHDFLSAASFCARRLAPTLEMLSSLSCEST